MGLQSDPILPYTINSSPFTNKSEGIFIMPKVSVKLTDEETGESYLVPADTVQDEVFADGRIKVTLSAEEKEVISAYGLTLDPPIKSMAGVMRYLCAQHIPDYPADQMAQWGRFTSEIQPEPSKRRGGRPKKKPTSDEG